MSIDAFDRVLAVLQSKGPFKIFSVVMNNGDVFQVDHPGAFSFRDGVAVYIAPGGHLKLFDHESVNQFSVENMPVL